MSTGASGSSEMANGMLNCSQAQQVNSLSKPWLLRYSFHGWGVAVPNVPVGLPFTLRRHNFNFKLSLGLRLRLRHLTCLFTSGSEASCSFLFKACSSAFLRLIFSRRRSSFNWRFQKWSVQLLRGLAWFAGHVQDSHGHHHKCIRQVVLEVPCKFWVKCQWRLHVIPNWASGAKVISHKEAQEYPVVNGSFQIECERHLFLVSVQLPDIHEVPLLIRKWMASGAGLSKVGCSSTSVGFPFPDTCRQYGQVYRKSNN